MRLGIFAKTFAGETPLAVLAAAAKAGFSNVQYNMACSGSGALPLVIEPEIAHSVRVASTQTSVSIAAVSATYNMTHPDMKKRKAGRQSFAAIAVRAKAMGTNLLTVCSGSMDANDQWRHHPDNDSPEAWAAMMAEFDALIEIAEREDIFIGVEPELANIVSSAPKAKQMIDALNSNRVKIVLDPANLFEVASANKRRDVIEEAVELLGPHIIMAHAKDRDAHGGFIAAGKGVIDFPHFISCLKSVGFHGSLVTHGLSAAEAPEVASFLKSLSL